jgi:RNA polymerase sigma-70 factor (ECF subfamily)
MSAVTAFEAERKRLTNVAYRMLGRWVRRRTPCRRHLRWQAADHAAIATPAAWLTTVIVRLCLDRMRRAKASREVYVGPWLPEPILTMEGGERREAEMESFADDLSLGLMVVLERLGPEERAAFILREAFDSSYADIASALGKNEPAVRQLISRARERVRAERPRFRAAPDAHQRLMTAFLSAVAANDTSRLVAHESVHFISDGGGKAPAYGS